MSRRRHAGLLTRETYGARGWHHRPGDRRCRVCREFVDPGLLDRHPCARPGAGAGRRAVAWRFVGRCGATVRVYGPVAVLYLGLMSFPVLLGAAVAMIVLTPARYQ